jgi:ATP-dependent Lon protease
VQKRDDDDPLLVFQAGPISTTQSLAADLGLPTLVVMPKAKCAKLKADHAAFKEILDVALPLVRARDLATVRATLHAEYPHAVTAVDLLLRDLCEGEPIRMKPAILVGSFGSGKSRIIRRMADLLGIDVFRFDGGSSSDGVGYGGTPRGWAESTPCVPARAVQQFKIANPIVAVDELDKASANPRNGALWSVLLQHLERETSSRFRDAALDAELDLGFVSHCATANSVDPLPAPLRDRYRIIRVPNPTLAHLSQLAANVMRDLATEDEARAGDEPLADDELAVVGKAWAARKFSMRALQKIVAATLEARDQHAMRH